MASSQPPLLSTADAKAVVQAATKGWDDLVHLSQIYVEHDKKQYHTAATPTPTSSFAIDHMQLIGTLDEMTLHDDDGLSEGGADDHSSAAATTVLATLSMHDDSILLKHSVLKSPVLFVKDRDVLYVEIRRSCVDTQGRPGLAWFRQSVPSPAMTTATCIRASVKSWGAVYIQVTPHVLSRFSMLDIDWNGSMSSWVAARVTARRVSASP
ncbi:hypothetical protein As57867_000935, partial [Aphanomyces stellatus]